MHPSHLPSSILPESSGVMYYKGAFRTTRAATCGCSIDPVDKPSRRRVLLNYRTPSE